MAHVPFHMHIFTCSEPNINTYAYKRDILKPLTDLSAAEGKESPVGPLLHIYTYLYIHVQIQDVANRSLTDLAAAERQESPLGPLVHIYTIMYIYNI